MQQPNQQNPSPELVAYTREVQEQITMLSQRAAQHAARSAQLEAHVIQQNERIAALEARNAELEANAKKPTSKASDKPN